MTTIIERTPATRSTYAGTVLVHLGFMTAWLYGFANSSRALPGLVVAVLLVLPAVVHFGAGFVIARHEALALLAYPPVLALVAPGLAPALWMPLVLLAIFPGAPLVLLGHFLRRRLDPEEPGEDWF